MTSTIKTRDDWEAKLKELQQKLSKTPKTRWRGPPPCNHNQSEYGDCTCYGSEDENWEYQDIEQQIKKHLQAGQFCDCGRLIEPDFAHCPSCGQKAVVSLFAHTNCKNWTMTFKFCPDCGIESLKIPMQ